MKILIAGDIHNQPKWLDRLAEVPCDLLCLSGDCLDGQAESGIKGQMETIKRWAAELKTPCAICSGNHDANTPERGFDPESETAGSDYWMADLKRETPPLVSDRESRLIQTDGGPVVVTTLPYEHESGEEAPTRKVLLEHGAELRRRSGALWVVLHHEPPYNSPTGGIWGNNVFYWEIRSAQPDFVGCGHAHDQPFHPEGAFHDKIGKSWVFNPGYPGRVVAGRTTRPNTVLIDTVTLSAKWLAQGRTKTADKTISL